MVVPVDEDSGCESTSTCDKSADETEKVESTLYLPLRVSNKHKAVIEEIT